MAVAVAAALLDTGPAAAQDTDVAAADATLTGRGEVIEVTGTLLAREPESVASSVVVIPAAELRRTGATSIQEVLQRHPAVTLQGLNRNSVHGGGGRSSVDLRNLRPERTLLLVNGRRTAISALSFLEAADLNHIPIALVDRVEILLDGASAVYGSDAIGGVINVILVKDFEGLRLDAWGGLSPRPAEGSLGLDGESVSAAATAGRSFARGNLTVNASYSRVGELMARDHPWSREEVRGVAWIDPRDPARGVAKTVGSPLGDGGRVLLPAGTGMVEGDGRSELRFWREGETVRFAAYPEGENPHRYNGGAVSGLTLGQERFSATALAHTGLGAARHRLRAYGEASFARRTSHSTMTPPSIVPDERFPDGLRIPLRNPHVPTELVERLARHPRYALRDDEGAPYLALSRRLDELGNRITVVREDQIRLVAGLEGRLSRLRWDAHVNWAQTASTGKMNDVNRARAAETADPVLCDHPVNRSRGCQVGNYFGLGLDPAVIEYIHTDSVSYTDHDALETRLLISGPVAPAPGGELGVALGGGLRRAAARYQPDALAVAGDAGLLRPSEGTYHAAESFAELSLPLARGLPALDALAVDLSGRISYFEHSGTALTYRTALSLAPIAGLELRASHATAFRAPNVGELHAGVVDTWPHATDPCSDWPAAPDPAVRDGCARAGVPQDYRQGDTRQVLGVTGGNRSLRAETARVLDVGAVVSPRLVDGLSLSAGYYRIHVDGAIMRPDVSDILRACHGRYDPEAEACVGISRDAGGRIARVDATLRNVGELDTSGIDMAARYDLRLGRAGDVSLAWAGNYLLRFAQGLYGERVTYHGTIRSGQGTYAHLRWLARASYGRGPWSLESVVRYIGGARRDGARAPSLATATTPATPGEPFYRVPAIAYWDLSLAHQRDRLDVVVGVDNLLDQAPPFFLGPGNSSGQTYDHVGRFVFTRVGVRF
jgi:outer membrane receptor protein involved in Fe transport